MTDTTYTPIPTHYHGQDAQMPCYLPDTYEAHYGPKTFTIKPKGHRNEAGDYIESPEEYAANFERAMTFTPEQEARSARARKALGWNAD